MDAAVKPEPKSASVVADQPRKVSVVNGYIVYTRAKRSLHSRNGFSEHAELKANVVAKTELEKESSEVAVRTRKRCWRSETEAKSECCDDQTVEIESEQVVANGGLGGSRNKMELKMSKKIVVNRKPMTVKELLDTGFLDGVSVVYMGGIKKVRFHMNNITFWEIYIFI